MIRRGIGVQSFVSAGGAAPTDADAQAFITAAGITDATQRSAINTLVTDLKVYGIWTKMKAIYPFVGGTSSTHKWNLKDPRDLDAAYRLVFSGGWTHSSDGATPNGTNGYANTFLNPRNSLTGFSQHVCNYSRTQNQNVNGVQIGLYDGTSEINLYQFYSLIASKGGSCYVYPSRAVLINNTNTRGLQIINRTANNSLKLHFNGSILATNTTTETLTRPNDMFYLGASNWTGTGANQYAPHQHSFDSIGDGLTDTEAANLYTAVQAFQTTLGRQV